MNVIKKARGKFRNGLKRIRRHWCLSSLSSKKPGSWPWLVRKELQFGGLVRLVERNKVSPLDPRSAEQLKVGGMHGGDRMLEHWYSPVYAKHLERFVEAEKPITLLEVGILKGSGLAIWCDLFPTGRVVGLDIDLDHTKRNLPNLKEMGAFRCSEPELYEFDQYLDNRSYVEELLKGGKIDIAIDDGMHQKVTILKTIESLLPHLAPQFVYFIEDNDQVHRDIRELYPNFKVENQGEMTVIWRD